MKRLDVELEQCKRLIVDNSRCREDLIERMSHLIKDRGEISSFSDDAADARLRLDNMEGDRHAYLMELDDSDLEDEREQQILRILRSMTIVRQYLTLVEQSIKTLSEHVKESETRLKLHKMKHEAVHSRLCEKLATIGRSLRDVNAKHSKLPSRNNVSEAEHHES